MGTSLSGLTPATTFDGLLKVGDNDPLTADLKAISTGDGTDTILSLSTGALQIGGATTIVGVDNDYNTVGFEIQRSDSQYIFRARNRGAIQMGSGIDWIEMNSNNNGIRLKTSNVERARITEIGLGIGETTPTSRLHVKGSGATSATTSLLVQNSAGTDMLKVQDDGGVTLGTLSSNGGSILFKSASGSLTYGEISVNSGSGEMKIGATRNSFFPTFYSSGSEAMRINTDQFVGIGETTPTARLHIKGSGNDNTTTSLLVQNSDGDDALKVTDDKRIYIGDTISDVMPSLSLNGFASYAHLNAYSSIDLRIRNNSALSISSTKKIGINTTTPTAQLQVKGSGNDDTTTALLVQNSDGADMLKVLDNGQISASGDRLTIGDSADVTLRILASGNAAAGNNYIQPLGTPANQRVVVTGNSVATIKAVDLDASNVYIGHGINQTAATGTLSIKGSGATSATTALLVENSAGTELLKVVDDGNVQVAEYIYPADGTTNSRFRVSNSAGTYMYYSTGNLKLNPNLVYTSTTYGTVFSVSNSTGDFSLNGAAGAKMAIKGNGATSATTSLLVQNSAGTELLKVEDGGAATFSGNTSSLRFYTNLGFYHSSNSNNVLSPNSTTGWVLQTANATGNIQVKNFNVTASKETTAALQVDSTTQGFLPPRMTDAERDAITNPAPGLMVYDTSNNQMNYWNGSTWIAF